MHSRTFLQSLYGHYLLPNGKLAHFALGDTVRKGHKVRGSVFSV